jgi:hypothetical protein
MADEVATIIEKYCNDLEETLKELFSSRWIANVKLAIACVILYSSLLLPKPTCKALNLRANKNNRNLKSLENTYWCKVIENLWNQLSFSSKVEPGFEIKASPRVTFKFRYLNRGLG